MDDWPAGVLAAWVVLLPVTGFVVTSLSAFMAIMVSADYDRPKLRTWAIWIGSGITLVLAFWRIMAEVLPLRMPTAIFL